jgi:cell division septum initiation protein DivIVA
MEITPRELRDVEIAEAFRGYNREVVNDLLERAAATVEASDDRIRELGERLKAAQLEADRSRETEDILHRTLLLAQRAADEAVAEAQQKSRAMLEEAELESHKLLADAHVEAQRRGDEERERLEDEVIDLAARRDTLLADVEALTQFEADFRERLVSALDADLVRVRDRESLAPGPLPELQAVEIPAAPERVAQSEARPEEQPVEPAAPSTEAAEFEAAFTPYAETSSPRAAAGDAPAGDEPPSDTATSEPPVATRAEEAFVAAAATDTPPFETGDPTPTGIDQQTREVDMTALFDAEAPDAEPAFSNWTPEPTSAYEPDVTATPEAGPAPAPDAMSRGDTAFDTLRPDVLDAEVLDDDAFFATLREAVHDDTPLGPRDESSDETDFFGEEGERSTFRDVFRRRR